MKKKWFLFSMNWKPLCLFLSASAVIAPFDLHSKVYADPTFKDLTINKPSINYGYFEYTKPSVSIASYARSRESKTLFAVAITTDNQVIDKNGLVVPTALSIDCKKGSGQFNFMEKLPAGNEQEYTKDVMNLEIYKFCTMHKQTWKHSDW